MAAPDLSPWSHTLCLHSCSGWTSHHGTNTPQAPSPYTHCSSVTRITLYFVQEGLAVPRFLSLRSLLCLWLLCVCARVYTCVRASICSFITYLLSAHYVPGTVAEFLWVCLLMLPLLLWGPLSVLSLSPNCYLFVSLGVSGSVHPCVCFSPSLSLCRTLCVSLSLPWCLTLPLCPLITLGL